MGLKFVRIFSIQGLQLETAISVRGKKQRVIGCPVMAVIAGSDPRAHEDFPAQHIECV